MADSALMGLKTAERAELIAFYKEYKDVKTQAFDLAECRELVAQNDRPTFREDRVNWLLAIQQHAPGEGAEIATQLFEYYLADEDTERASLLRVWENLAGKIQKQGTDFRNLALLWQQMGILATSQGRLDNALNYFQNAAQDIQQTDDNILLGNIYYEIGIVYRNIGDYSNAWQTFEKSTEYARAAGNIKTVIYAQGQLANLLAVQSRFPEAIEILKNSLPDWESLPSESDRNMKHTTIHTLGRTYLQNGQYREAKETLQESLRIKEMVNERFDITLRTRATLAEVCINLGEFQEADQYLREEDIDKLERSGSYLYSASAYKTLSQLRYAQGNHSESRRLADRALDIADQSNNPLTQFEVLLWALPSRLRRLDIVGFMLLFPRFLRVFFRLRLSPLEIIKLVIKRLLVTINPFRVTK